MQRGFKLREKLANTNFGMARPNSLHLLPSTPQIRGLHTFIRNKDTPRDEFIFYSKRLIRLVIEHALALLPFRVSLEVNNKLQLFVLIVLIIEIQENLLFSMGASHGLRECYMPCFGYHSCCVVCIFVENHCLSKLNVMYSTQVLISSSLFRI